MAFFKSFQQSISLPSVSSIVGTLSSAVDDITSVVEEVSSSVADSVTEQVTSMIHGLRTEEGENHMATEENSSRPNAENVSQGPSTYGYGVNSNIPNVDIQTDSVNYDRSDRSSHRRQEQKQNHYDSPEYSSNADHQRQRTSAGRHQEAEDMSYLNCDFPSDTYKDKKGRLKRSKENIDEDNESESGYGFTNAHHRSDKYEAGGKSKTISHKNTDSEGTHKVKQRTHGNNKANYDSEENSNNIEGSKEVRHGYTNNTHSNKQDINNRKVAHKETTQSDIKQRRNPSDKEKSPCKGKDRSASRRKSRAVEEGRDKSKSKNGRDFHGSSSESEDEVLGKYQEAMTRQHTNRNTTDKQQNYTWETRQKYSPLSAEYDGYSSEVSADEANCIQRMRRTPPLDELQPPPYQDDSGSPRLSCTPSEIGDSKCELSRCSNSPRYSFTKCPSEGSMGHEAESFQNKGYEEDVPSDSTAVLSPEDMSARGSSSQLPKSFDPEPVAKYGTLDVTFDYDSQEQKLLVTVTAVTDLPTHNRTGNNNSWQVHLVLLPVKKQRAKTAVQRGPCPAFTETFKFNHIESEMIANYAVRFRLYLVRRMKKERMVGEKIFYLTKLNLQGKLSLPVVLEPAYSLSGCDSQMSMSEMSCTESTSSCQSLVHGSVPEILIGLLYNATTGRLSAEVIKGSHFKNLSANRPPNTYVKLTLMNSMGQEMSKCKTSIRRGQSNPLYKETFIFQVALFQLSEVTLILSVYNKRSMKRKELIGWISLGLNSSGDEQLNHWTEMKESKGQQVCRWHTLLES
ncbi:hypothetical protein XENTR_v10013319 [Xenopus tropicalis]|uniref:Synaptotagmin 14 n=1 Tax=Xenopus tropicalis TaxID=8364 RepID=A0A803K567_XENTR|nr:synaptotagmin-14 isoform X2 [Xenopus tropicalis]KAE8600575.1 hypothetical protein XENTR_v10013319 [Xenopus tropicalis]|eukprot:XP_012817120.1 PREDICTED: synaptotagmin-14 isoform X2 [Xenopus tropicalis]